MNIIINSLSVTNTSGRHVLMGHLKQIVPIEKNFNYVVLYHENNKDMIEELGTNIKYLECPSKTKSWKFRYMWEKNELPSLIKELDIDCLFSPAGLTVPGIKIPQVVFCQNPWCLVPSIHYRLKEKAKAFLQQKAYKRAQKDAAVMVYNSNYMKKAYDLNAGFEAKKSFTVYQGANDSTFETAKKYKDFPKDKNLLLTVSAMGNHKGIETVVYALQILKEKYELILDWKVIGAWPDKSYENKIKSLVQDLGIQGQVHFAGHVSREELEESYARAKVFCLMSQCESFGIPAVEAQVYGTPVVCSNVCAMPEIEGEGGLYPEVNNAEDTAEKLYSLFLEDELWEKKAYDARKNAERFRWSKCSPELLLAFEYIDEKFS
ncbi:MAG: glycosyltransferase [Lentisphaeria bacterium]|nr:glycosyltransferase [Lentisphaeria bacterium]